MTFTDAELRDLYVRYASVLHRRCLGILRDPEEAADVVQETFARVLVHHESFRRDASPLTWMYRISTNLCLNRIRDRACRAGKHAAHRDEIAGSEAVCPEAWEGEATVRRLLEESDAQTRAIVIHLFYDDMTREEAARMAGVSVPTLRKRLNAFLERARAATGGRAAVPALLLLLLGAGGAP
jgi:RNA polymerase sigma factor (sigma-70 family)